MRVWLGLVCVVFLLGCGAEEVPAGSTRPAPNLTIPTVSGTDNPNKTGSDLILAESTEQSGKENNDLVLVESPTVEPSATAMPTAVQLPTVTPVPPSIVEFTSSSSYVAAGESYRLSWASTGAEMAELEIKPIVLSAERETLSVEPTGELELVARGEFEPFWPSVTYVLRVSDPAGQMTEQQITVTFACSQTYFFDLSSCPNQTALYSTAQQQAFEHGFMIWVQAQNLIYVFYDNMTIDVYIDTWTNGEPIDDPGIIPPAGFYQPTRGFGKVWRTELFVRDRLGWATDLPETYEGAYQCEPELSPAPACFLRSVEDAVLKLEGGLWARFAEN